MKRTSDYAGMKYTPSRKKISSGYTKKSAMALITAIKRKQQFGSEKKTVDVQVVSTAISATPQFFLLNGLNSGTAVYNRIGSKTTIKSFQFRASIDPVGAQANTDVVRIIVFYDKNANKTLPTLASLIESKNAIGTPLSNIDDMRNIDNTERYKILYDQEFYLPAVSGTPFITSFNSEYPGVIDWYKKLDLPSQYTGTQIVTVLPTIAEITSGSLYMMMYSSVATGYTVSGVARIRFEDN